MASYEFVAHHLREMLPNVPHVERSQLAERAVRGAGPSALCLSVSSYELALGATDWWRAEHGLIEHGGGVSVPAPPARREVPARDYGSTEVGELWRLNHKGDAQAHAELTRRVLPGGSREPAGPVGVSYSWDIDAGSDVRPRPACVLGPSWFAASSLELRRVRSSSGPGSSSGPKAPSFGLSHSAYCTEGEEGGDSSVPLPTPRFAALPSVGRVQMEFCPTGSLVKVLPCKKSGRVGPGGKRGKVHGFSAASRLRLMRHLSCYERASMEGAIFITLTYGALFPSPAVAKVHLDRFLKRLRREFPEAGGLWRMEWQERGAVHFHLLVLGISFIDYKWTAAAWAAVADGLASEKAGTETRRVNSCAHALHYVSKYLAKSTPAQGEEAEEGGEGQEAEEGPGRLWGHFGEWRKYQSAKVRLVLERGQAARVARTLDGLRFAGLRASVKAKKKKGRPAKHYRARRKAYLARGATWFLDVSVLWSRLLSLVGPVREVCAAVMDAKTRAASFASAPCARCC